MLNNDIEQRKLAMDVSQSFIVQAPAGSGKTELLIQRLLALLSTVNSPEEILAITFTKKAANEMRERIYHALYQATLEEPAEAHKKNTWRLAKRVLECDKLKNWHLLENPNQLKIQTIDSLCAFITSQLPLLSHFGSQPRLSDNPDSLYEEAIHEILSHLEENLAWSEPVGRLLFYLDNDLNKVHELLVNLLKRRDQWLPHIHSLDDNLLIKTRLEESIFQVADEHLALLKSLLPISLENEIESIYQYSASHLPYDENDEEIAHWNKISTLLLTEKGTWRKRVSADIGFPAKDSIKNKNELAILADYKKRFADLIEVLESHEHFRVALFELRKLPSLTIPNFQLHILIDLINVLKISTAQLRLSFQRYGQIDFTENSLAAIFALGTPDNPTDLALALDYKIQHILVDEFQDTSSTQFQLLQKLTLDWQHGDGRTLFIVGDPMQSIYRFREAEVGLFIRMRENGIGNVQLVPITLTHNFRSYGAIVDWNNRLFNAIFPAFSNIATGAVPYSESISTKEKDETADIDINCKGFVSVNGDDEALHIVKQIQCIKEKAPDDSIAILVRSRSHLRGIIPVLKEANLPYKAVDIDLLSSRQSIQDLFALTSALLHPYDRIAWLSILRAPWCGLTLNDLHCLAGDANQPIIEQLGNIDIIAKLDPDGSQRVNRIFPILSAAIANRNRYSMRYLVESTWNLLGGPACIDNESIKDILTYFELLDKFSEDGGVLHLENLKEAIKKLYASSETASNAIQIMTIHSAKGLEFDTVILPHLEKKNPSDEKQLLAWLEQPLKNDDSALLISPISRKSNENNSLYHYITRQQRIKLEHETDRLLYVAATRAKKRLYLSFTLKDEEKKNITGSFLGKIWPVIEKEIEINKIDNPVLTDTTSQLFPLSRLVKDWKNPLDLPPVDTSGVHQTYQGFYLRQQAAKQIGTSVHLILQQIGIQGLDWWVNNIKDQGKYIERLLKSNGVPQKLLLDGIESVKKMLTNVVSNDKGRWIFDSHLDARSEYAISCLLDDKVVQLVVDRTFVDESGVRWVIDFKTAAPSGKESVQEFLESEKSTYQKQMDKYREAFRGLEDRVTKFGLFFPAVAEWVEWG